MIKICICDDFPLVRRHLRLALEDVLESCKAEYTIAEVEDARQLLTATENYNLLFMDIQFGEDKIGMDVARQLRERDDGMVIVFVTSYADISYIQESIKIGTFRYITKPFKPQEIEELIVNVLTQKLPTASTLVVKTALGQQFITTKDIAYIEILHKHSLIVMKNGEEIECRENIRKLAQRLPRHTFCFAQISYLVNLDYISTIKHSKITMKNGAVISISRLYRAGFMDALHSKNWG